MDGARKSDRKFPSYTTAELKAFLLKEPNAEIEAEIARREAGLSKPFHTPQI